MASFSVPGAVRTLRQSPVPVTMRRWPAVKRPGPTVALTVGAGEACCVGVAGVAKAGGVGVGDSAPGSTGVGDGLAAGELPPRS